MLRETDLGAHIGSDHAETDLGAHIGSDHAETDLVHT